MMKAGTGTHESTGRQETVSVDIRLRGALVARAGARQGRVAVPEGSTVAETVEQWADEYGSRLRVTLLDGKRLRTDIHAVRVDNGERLAASQPVTDGDTIRFRFCD